MEFFCHDEVICKGFILRVGEGSTAYWALFLTEDRKPIELLMKKGVISHEDVKKSGIKIIGFSKKDIIADKSQRPTDHSFGHLINTFTYKFEGGKDKTTEWLKNA